MESIANSIIIWYLKNKRELPWRETKDPYCIWISEVILQQTRVAQGLDYYVRFMERFPDVKALAAAAEDEVMKHWQGLGYYSRARNLHAAARDIVERFGGAFPETYKNIRSLKGIGEYTAAAICSIAWQQPYAVVDGNVYRVLSRLFGIETPIDTTEGKKNFAILAQELMDRSHPDIYNQGIMEFGALQCVPKSPDCLSCVLQHKCVAFSKKNVEQLPVKQGKTQVKPRYFNYLDVHSKGRILLAKRTAKDIWMNLYEYPLLETDKEVELEELQQDKRFLELFQGIGKISIKRHIKMPRHILSHRIIHARFYEVEVSEFSAVMNNYLRVEERELENYAVARLIELYRIKKQESQ